MLPEQSAQLALAQPEATGQFLHPGLVQRAQFDQGQRARHDNRRAPPRPEIGGGLGPATQAWPKSRLLGRGGGGKKHDALGARRARRTDRAGRDARWLEPGKKAAGETGRASDNTIQEGKNEITSMRG